MKPGITFLLSGVLLILSMSPAQAAATLATPDQDRRAKQAVPPAGKALIYVYRLDDTDTGTGSGLWLNGRDSGQLEPRTYGMWAAGPGRLDIRAGKVDATPLTFTCAAGRVYFVQLSVNKDQSVSLKQVAYGTGRTELGQARLVLDPALAARVAVAPKPAALAAAPAQKAPVFEEPAKARQTSGEDEKARGGVTLIVKAGSFQLASSPQTILGLSRSFSEASVAYGLEGEWRLANGFAFGLEVFGHTQEYTTAVPSLQSGDMTVTNVFINAKKYFRPNALVQPYLGIGLGSASVDFSTNTNSGITGSAGGVAVQGMAGVALRWQHVGIYSEFKYARTEIEDSIGQTVDTSGSGLFVGMSVHF